MSSNPREFPKEIKLADRTIGDGHPTYIIADIGANFDRDLEKAKRLATAAKEAGADMAKFQTFRSRTIVSGPSFQKMKADGTLKGVHGTWSKPIDRIYEEVEFPFEWHQELADHCRKIGVHFGSSAYDFEAVDLLDEVGVPFFKIGSGEITWPRMLQYTAKKGKPLILATGDTTLAEIDEAIRWIEETGNRNLVLLQCITNYPSKIESANVNVLKTYREAYDILIGYSDHSPGDVVVLGSTALGGCVIEKHFTLSKSDPGPDHPHSMEPHEFKAMVERVRQMESALGSSRKEPVEEEATTVLVQRRSLHSTKALPAGHVLGPEDIIPLRPAIGIAPKFEQTVVGMTLQQSIGEREALTWEHFRP